MLVALLLGAVGWRFTAPSRRAAEVRAAFPIAAEEIFRGAAMPHADGFRLAREDGRALATLPGDGQDGIVLHASDGAQITLHELHPRAGRGKIVDGAVVYGSGSGARFWSSAKQGVEEWLLETATRGAPIAEWSIEGAKLAQRGEEIFAVDTEGQAKLKVTAPRAYGAEGAPIAARLEVREQRLALFVDARDGERVLVDPLWTTGAALNHARRGAVATVLTNGDVLVTGGEDAGGAPVAEAERYDVLKGTWTDVGSPTVPRTLHGAVMLRTGKVLIVGGQTSGGARTTSCELFDPETNAWLPTGSLATARDSHTTTILSDGDVLITGGADAAGIVLASTERYSPIAGTWTASGALATARARHAATLRNDGKVLVTGGDDGAVELASTEVWNAGGFTAGPILGSPRSEHSATLDASGKIIIAGGRLGGSATATAEYWSSDALPFAALSSFTTGRYRHQAVLLPSGHVTLVGGLAGGSALASADLLGDDSSWGALPPLATARSRTAVALLFTGKVLVIGGQGAAAPLASTELLDEYLLPGPQHWTQLATQITGRRFGTTATLLANGKVVVFGGTNAANFSPMVVLYDSTTNSWSRGASATVVRLGHTASRLLDGRVFVTGGDLNGTGPDTVSAEIYDPVSNVSTATPPTSRGRRHSESVTLEDGTVLIVSRYSTTSVISELFDPVTGTFSDTIGTLSPQYRGALLAIPGGALLIGGYNSADQPSTVVQRYSTASKTWTARASMSVARDARGVAVALDANRILVAGASDRAIAQGEVYRIDTNTWSTVAAMPSARGGFKLIAQPSGAVDAIGGLDAANRVVANSWRYDPVANSWTVRPGTLTSAHINRTASVGGSTFYAHNGPPAIVALPDGDALLYSGSVDGDVSSRYSARADRYHAALGSFSAAGALPASTLEGGSATVVLRDGRVLVGPGSGVYANSVTYFDPFTRTVTDGPYLSSNVTNMFNATLLFDGRVLFAGSTSSMIFNPTSGESTMLPAPLSGSFATAPVLLPDGRVAIYASNSNRSSLFNPSDNTWSAPVTLPFTMNNTTLVLPNGNVMATHSTGAYQGNAATNTWTNVAGNTGVPWSLMPLPNGFVLRGALNNTARYDYLTQTWTALPATLMAFNTLAATPYTGNVVLPSGRLLYRSFPMTIFDWQTDRVTTLGGAISQAPTPIAVLPTQEVLYNDNTFGATVFSELPPASDQIRPRIQTMSNNVVTPGQTVTLTGVHLNGDALSATPLVLLRRSDSNWISRATVTAFSETELSFTIPQGQLAGLYGLWVSSNGVPSYWKTLLVIGGYGNVCTQASDCATGNCVDGVCCNVPCNAGACDACSVAAGAAIDGICAILPSTFLCRAKAEACDAAEFCNGSSGACPSNAPASAGTTCRGAIGPCDVAELCDGTAFTCPTDSAANAGVECRAATDDCDMAERCNGTNPACPFDDVQPTGATCRASADSCDAEETCDGVTKVCPVDEVALNGTLCRAASSICDVAESCDGVMVGCPSDTFASAGAQCRAQNGICDLAEVCSGLSPNCPADSYLPTTTECRAQAGDCDAAEHCTGASGACPVDLPASSSTVCRTSAGDCDPVEKCDGASKSCPADRLSQSGILCRVAQGACDLDERCTGSSASCPANAFKSSAVTCRAALGPCDVAETCDGASADCPVNALRAAGVSCRDASDLCDEAETCDGASASCPLDLVKVAGASCRTSIAMCDVAEVCDGASRMCPADSGTSARTTIRRDANLLAAVGTTYRYNVENHISLEGPSAEDVTYKRCEGTTLPAGFVVDEQTGYVSWTPSAAGDVTLCVAIDSGCGADSYSFTVSVAATAPSGPVASFVYAPAIPNVMTSVDFDATASRADGGGAIFAYDWAFGDGVGGIDATTAHTYTLGGAYTTRLTVTDAYGASAQTSDIVTVIDPLCDVFPRVTIATEPLVVYGTTEVTHSCDCQDVRFYSWELGDGATSEEASPRHEYAPGRYRIRLVGGRSPGCIAQDAVYLEVRTTDGVRPPICQAFTSAASGAVPWKPTLSALWADPNADGKIVSAVWTVDDEAMTTSTKPKLDVTLDKPGRYHAKLKVIGTAGLSCETEVELNALSPTGASMPTFLSRPSTTATCGEPYHYDVDNDDKPTVRGASSDGIFSISDDSADLKIDSASGRVQWTPAKGIAEKKRVTLRFDNDAGRATQSFEVDVRCQDGGAGCGCDLGNSERSSTGNVLFALLLLGASSAALRRRSRP